MISKILIIDNEKDYAESLRDLLDNAGYKIKIANTGQEGLSKIKEFRPTLVLCDINVPKSGGFAVLKEMQQDIYSEDIPFIFLSASSDMSDFRKGLEMGADDYLVKPIEYGSLIRSVEACIIKHKNKVIPSHYEQSGIRKELLTENSIIFITLDNHPNFIKINQIVAINSSNQYTTLYIADNRQRVFRKSLKTWEQTLPKSTFLRISRSTIINTNYISRVEKWLQFSYKIYIRGIDKPFQLSRRYASRIRKQI